MSDEVLAAINSLAKMMGEIKADVDKLKKSANKNPEPLPPTMKKQRKPRLKSEKKVVKKYDELPTTPEDVDISSMLLPDSTQEFGPIKTRKSLVGGPHHNRFVDNPVIFAEDSAKRNPKYNFPTSPRDRYPAIKIKVICADCNRDFMMSAAFRVGDETRVYCDKCSVKHRRGE